MEKNQKSANYFDFYQTIKKRKEIIFISFIVISIVSIALIYLMKPEYSSSAQIKISLISSVLDTSDNQSKAIIGNRHTYQGGYDFFKSEKRTLESNDFIYSKVNKELDLGSIWGVPEETVIAILKEGTTVTRVAKTDILRITFTHQNRELVPKILLAIIDAYKEYRTKNLEKYLQKAKNEFIKSINDLEVLLTEKKNVLDSVCKLTGIPYDPESTKSLSLHTIEKKYADIEARILEAEIVKGRINNDIKKIDAILTQEEKTTENNSNLRIFEEAAYFLMSQSSNQTSSHSLILKEASQNYLKAKENLLLLSEGGLGKRHPKVKLQDLKLQETLYVYRKQFDTGYTLLRQALEKTNTLITALEKQKQAIKKERAIATSNVTEYSLAKQNYETQHKALEKVKKDYQQFLTGPDLSLNPLELISKISKAKQTGPKYKLYFAIGAFCGLFFGVIIAFIAEMLDTSIHSIEDVELATGLEVIGIIPEKIPLLYQEKIKTDKDLPDAEAYRILATNISFQKEHKTDSVFTVASGGSGEGKSTSILNLAYSYAEIGYSVLVVDADLRRPMVHKYLNLPNEIGLLQYLQDDRDIHDVIQPTAMENLHIITSGVGDTSSSRGLVNSKKIADFTATAKELFNIVLFDVPPILGVNDAAIITEHVDGVIIVVQHRKLPKKVLSLVQEKIAFIKAKTLGVVINNVDVNSDFLYHYYTSYYTYYGADQSNAKQQKELPTTASNAKKEQEEKDVF